MDNGLCIDLNVLSVESEDEYHAKGRSGEYLSSHLLADFRKCPLLYFQEISGLAGDTDRPAYALGRAAHKRILEGRDAYEAAYAFGGPINPKTGRHFGSNTKAFAEWAAVQGRPVLTEDQVELIENLAAGVAMNDRAVDLLLYGRAEGVARADYCNVPCQICIDWTHPHEGIVDLKSCDDLTWLEADARRYGYMHQMAFYQAVLAEAIGMSAPCYIIGVEKRPPHRAGVWLLDGDLLASCRQENEAAIGRLRECQRMAAWPTGYERQRVLSL